MPSSCIASGDIHTPALPQLYIVVGRELQHRATVGSALVLEELLLELHTEGWGVGTEGVTPIQPQRERRIAGDIYPTLEYHVGLSLVSG